MGFGFFLKSFFRMVEGSDWQGGGDSKSYAKICVLGWRVQQNLCQKKSVS